MWNWTWQDPKDYGTKYDYGMLDVAKVLIEEFYNHKKADPAIGFLGFKHKKAPVPQDQKHMIPENLEYVNIEPWVKKISSRG
jgi:hypothetical protein